MELAPLVLSRTRYVLTGLMSTSHWPAELMTTLGKDKRSPPLTPCTMDTREGEELEGGGGGDFCTFSAIDTSTSGQEKLKNSTEQG